MPQKYRRERDALNRERLLRSGRPHWEQLTVRYESSRCFRWQAGHLETQRRTFAIPQSLHSFARRVSFAVSAGLLFLFAAPKQLEEQNF